MARTTLDELALRSGSGVLGRLLLLTTEGHATGIPRTVVLTGFEWEGETYALPWSPTAHWLRNLRANPDVVVDDRVSVRRARAHVADAEKAELIRAEVLGRLPGPLATAIVTSGVALRPGTPAVWFERH